MHIYKDNPVLKARVLMGVKASDIGNIYPISRESVLLSYIPVGDLNATLSISGKVEHRSSSKYFNILKKRKYINYYYAFSCNKKDIKKLTKRYPRKLSLVSVCFGWLWPRLIFCSSRPHTS